MYDYATSADPLGAGLFIVSMKGYMHLSDPMKRYVTTLDSHGNSLKENVHRGAEKTGKQLMHMLKVSTSL